MFFTTDPKTGFIEPGSSNIVGLEALKTADLLVVFLRFQDFPDDQMQHIADYLDRGGPVVGFRTATHAFQIKRPDAKFLKYDWQNKTEFPGGFGRQILGETWVSHYGTNHKQSSRLILNPTRPATRFFAASRTCTCNRRASTKFLIPLWSASLCGDTSDWYDDVSMPLLK